MSRRRTVLEDALKVGIVTIGDELLSGFVVNTNAAWIGSRLAELGCEVVHGITCGDAQPAIAAAVREAMLDADAVVVTGGLGPTSDDRTRHAMAEVAGVALIRDSDSEAELRRRLAERHRPASAAQLSMVDLPEGAQVLTNPEGTAPGFRVVIDGRPVFAVPGPPHEMRAVVESSVVKDLARRSRGVAVTRSLRTALMPESEVAELVSTVETQHSGIKVAYLAAPGEVVVRLTGMGSDLDLVRNAVDAASEDVRELLGDAVVGDADRTLAQNVVGLLALSGRTLALAESITGGGVAAAVTDVVGSSVVLRGGVVAYATDLKAGLLGVDAALLEEHGAIHPGVARIMAAEVRKRLGSHYGLATTGVAGPGESDGHPAGTVHVAVAGPTSTVVVSLQLHGDRERIRRQATVHALDLLRRFALGLPPRIGESSD